MDLLGAAASAVTVIGGLGGAVAWARRRRAHSALVNPLPPMDGIQVLPFTFKIDTFNSPPFVEVELYVINYTGKRLLLTDLKVPHLSVPGCPPLEAIPCAHEYELAPRRSQHVVCRRHLADSEAKAIMQPRHYLPVNGSVSLVARASAGRKEFRFGPVIAQRIGGGIQTPAA